jgi:hypothetical protein
MRVLPLALLALLAPSALAHQVGLSRGLYTQTDDGIELELVLARGEAVQAVPGLDGNGDGTLEQAELEAAAARLARDIVDHIRIDAARSGGQSVSCPGSLLGADLTDEDGLAVRARYACERSGRVTVDFALAARLTAGHRHLARSVTMDDGGAVVQTDHVALAGASTLSFGRDVPPPSRLAFIEIGVEHILLGFDHLVFLFGLVIVGGRARSMLAIITAFTVAHTITLALAVLGIVTPSPSVIEPLIAASIVYVGVENFFVKGVQGRWRITAAFGLVHGFGFAGALREVGLPKDEVASALLLFNVGVEAGQLLMLACALPLLHAARRRGLWSETVTKAASVVVILLGVLWLVERVLGALGITRA